MFRVTLFPFPQRSGVCAGGEIRIANSSSIGARACILRNKYGTSGDDHMRAPLQSNVLKILLRKGYSLLKWRSPHSLWVFEKGASWQETMAHTEKHLHAVFSRCGRSSGRLPLKAISTLPKNPLPDKI